MRCVVSKRFDSCVCNRKLLLQLQTLRDFFMFSVLMSVYYKENPVFLNESLKSIYDDQNLKPNQIILVKDGPLTNELEHVVHFWRVKLGAILTIVPLDENVGLARALNSGLQYSHNDLVARMDSDDIALPNRFSIQVDFMNKNPDIVASSATLEEWDQTLTTTHGLRRLPLDMSSIRKFAKHRSPLSHPLVIFRKAVILEVNGYPELRKGQDYALWSLLINKGYNLANLSVILLKMRAGDEMLDRRDASYFKYEYELLKFQRKIGFLSVTDFYLNLFMKGGLRLSPRVFKRWAYKLTRH